MLPNYWKTTLATNNYTFTPLPVFIVLSIGTAMEKATESATTEIEEKTGNYLVLSFSRAPKKNHDALEQFGKQFVQWIKKHSVRTEIYHLTTSEVPEGLESIAKTLSIGDDEEVWVILQFYRDQNQTDEVMAKMMKDESLGGLSKEIDGLVTQGKSMITGGFSRLRV
jgi:large subunit ribosomal protein L17